MNRDFFPDNYAHAKNRFRDFAKQAGAVLSSHSLSYDQELAIDVAIIDRENAARTVVVTSGLHGIEGFFGSAVQLAWLQQSIESRADHQARVVLVHALNPFGFANRRRANENNIDLNRNFLCDDTRYRGAPVAYSKLNSLLNPNSPRGPIDLFKLRALWSIATMGMPAIKQAVAGGQYEFPQGLFFGGKAASETKQIIHQNYKSWVDPADEVVHLDLHTGLGKSAACKLLIEHTQDDPRCEWYRTTFPAESVEPQAGSIGTAYETSGSLGSWLYQQFPELQLRFALAEFGTYAPLTVLAALRNENRNHFHSRDNESAKRELLECFCPASPVWRKQVLETGVDLINRVA